MVIKSFSDYASEATSNPPSYYIPSTSSQSSHLESTTTSSAPSEQPPAFQFYKPKTYSISKAKQRDINQNNALDWLPDPIGDVLTHDPHLNDDGEALYRFLLSNAIVPPSFTLKILGQHQETRLHHRIHHDHSTPNRNTPGNTNLRQHLNEERENVTITDFEFSIDLTHLLSRLRQPNPNPSSSNDERLNSPTVYVLPDSALAHRGSVWETIIRKENPISRARKNNFNSSNSIGRIRVKDSSLPNWNPGEEAMERGLLDGENGGERQFDRNDESLITFENFRPGLRTRRRMKALMKSRQNSGQLPWYSMDSDKEFEEHQLRYSKHFARKLIKWERVNIPSKAQVGDEDEEEVFIKTRRAFGESDRTAREISDDYCISESKLKSFEFKKEVVGWDLEKLKRAIDLEIRSTSYPHSIMIQFETSSDSVQISPSSSLARTLTFHQRINKWQKFLFWTLLICSGLILLVLPIVWGLRWYYGAHWNEVRVAWELKKWEELKSSRFNENENEDGIGDDQEAYSRKGRDEFFSTEGSSSNPSTSTSYLNSDHQARIVTGKDGKPDLILRGTREGDWLNEWKGLIKDGVKRGWKGSLEDMPDVNGLRMAREGEIDELTGL